MRINPKKAVWWMLLSVVALVFSASCANYANTTKDSQQQMLPKGLERKEISSTAVKEALRRVARRRFVPDEFQSFALEDRALEIGHGQTISQPFIVALMTEYAEVQDGSRVLEIGTGSGYQAAVLAELGAKVFSVEIIPELSEQARRVLMSLGYTDVELRIGDGALGWPEAAPFDAIIVTAASPVVPESLVKQLAPRGRMIIPIENKENDFEQLLLVSREGDSVRTKRLGAVRFVPMTGAVRQEPNQTPSYREPKLLKETLRGGASSEPLSLNSKKKKPKQSS